MCRYAACWGRSWTRPRRRLPRARFWACLQPKPGARGIRPPRPGSAATEAAPAGLGASGGSGKAGGMAGWSFPRNRASAAQCYCAFPRGISMNRFTAMEAFIRVIESGSFSSAARQLHIGQPSVSKLVAQLEDRLGVRLLLRSTHGLTPTEAGQNFYERAVRSLEEADEADLAARGAAAALSGRLRVCAAVTFARLHVVPRLPLFLAAHSRLEMEGILVER